MASHLPAAVLSSPIQNRVFEHPPCSVPRWRLRPPRISSLLVGPVPRYRVHLGGSDYVEGDASKRDMKNDMKLMKKKEGKAAITGIDQAWSTQRWTKSKKRKWKRADEWLFPHNSCHFAELVIMPEMLRDLVFQFNANTVHRQWTKHKYQNLFDLVKLDLQVKAYQNYDAGNRQIQHCLGGY
ncbi:hypothetical protein OsI_18841 [Oryza sativa Indica Group]|uniref:Uncharacterized protein n=2 Tax=Oryza sativa TaxID=4530 RepID=B9FN12_ORYSJ|nr:hypothetical protein OsI_18841 [Oryza sativa Indica Group]EEE62697.1 hypothetical protein OsJ_17500 [Oryza sativa Japonica Group]